MRYGVDVLVRWCAETADECEGEPNGDADRLRAIARILGNVSGLVERAREHEAVEFRSPAAFNHSAHAIVGALAVVLVDQRPNAGAIDQPRTA